MINRRDFLRNASLVALGGLLAGKPDMLSATSTSVFSDMEANSSKNFGLQIYSLGKELTENVPEGLKKVKSYGYNYIELAGYKDGRLHGMTLKEFKKICDDCGLEIRSTHVNPPVREYTKSNKQQIMDYWKKTAADHAEIGCKLLIQPGQPSTRSKEEVEYVGEIFNGAGEIAKAAGLKFGYHNHEGEFAYVKAGGKESLFGRRAVPRESKDEYEIIYDGFMKYTDPSLVFFEMDVYWTVMGQQDPVEYMNKYKKRIQALHIKDKAVLGKSGMMNFEQIFKLAYSNGIKSFFVELEGMKGGTQFEGVKGCADYLLGAKFVK